jgi:hypothetical protein
MYMSFLVTILDISNYCFDFFCIFVGKVFVVKSLNVPDGNIILISLNNKQPFLAIYPLAEPGYPKT